MDCETFQLAGEMPAKGEELKELVSKVKSGCLQVCNQLEEEIVVITRELEMIYLS